MINFKKEYKLNPIITVTAIYIIAILFMLTVNWILKQ